MADSQHPYSNLPEQVEAIRASISEQRFRAYLISARGDVDYAISLYLYNARLAKAFLYLLHVVEVTLRNSIDRYLVERFGVSWPSNADFRDDILDEGGRKALSKAIKRADGNSIHHQVVAKLPFDFWSRLLKREYHDFWRFAIKDVFPHLSPGVGRSQLQEMVRDVNKLRNRVAHHEPLLDLNIPDLQKQIFELLTIMCPETEAWTKHHNTVSAIMRGRPGKATLGRNSIQSKLSPKFVLVSPETTLDVVMRGLNRSCQAVVCMNESGEVTAAFSALEVTAFVMAEVDRNDGFFMPGETTVADLLQGCDAAETTRLIDDAEPIIHAVDALTEAKVHILVGTAGPGGKPTGTILRAQRRY